MFKFHEIQDVVVYKLKKFHDDRGWLAELFRHDELAEEFYPVMSYISFTKTGHPARAARARRPGRSVLLYRPEHF
jgi:dTDP-4-dehydrorhamnose 3,5-epimerase-like enzyme